MKIHCCLLSPTCRCTSPPPTPAQIHVSTRSHHLIVALTPSSRVGGRLLPGPDAAVDRTLHWVNLRRKPRS